MRYLIILFFLFCLAGCHYNKPVVDPYFTTYSYDGHDYVYCRSGYAACIVHSPKCKCLDHGN